MMNFLKSVTPPQGRACFFFLGERLGEQKCQKWKMMGELGGTQKITFFTFLGERLGEHGIWYWLYQKFLVISIFRPLQNFLFLDLVFIVSTIFNNFFEIFEPLKRPKVQYVEVPMPFLLFFRGKGIFLPIDFF